MNPGFFVQTVAAVYDCRSENKPGSHRQPLQGSALIERRYNSEDENHQCRNHPLRL
jgi:hypothetical protein